jgi:parvulin-like peptidyl-prolyl isomerase
MPLSINGELVEDSVIREEARALRPRYEAAIDGMDPVAMEIQLRDWSRENVIERVLLRQESLKDPKPIPAAAIDELLRQYRIESAGHSDLARDSDDEIRAELEARWRLDRLMQTITAKVSRPKYKEIGEYYRKHKEQFFTPEVIRASHIVKNIDETVSEAAALEKIKQAQAELNEGVSFEEVADRYSDCPGNGGDQGYFPRGQMVPAFDDVVFKLQVNETSDIFRTEFGFHIAKVYDRQPSGIRDLLDVREEIERALLNQKQLRAVEAFVDELRAKADIRNVPRREVVKNAG